MRVYGKATLIERGRRGMRQTLLREAEESGQLDLGESFLKKRKPGERVDRFWLIEAEPHIMIRLKRHFARIGYDQTGRVTITDTLEVARDLDWFSQRFPLEVRPAEYLAERVAAQRAQEALVAEVMAGDYQARPFELAVPAREYQRLGADLALRTHGLLLADDVGLGKTCTAICTLTEPATRPALVVTLTHLPRQWAAEVKRFAPALNVAIIPNGDVRDLTKGGTVPFPDVVICNYHKLFKWAEVLAPHIASIVFDEVQELRHRDTNRYTAAKALADVCLYRLGLSATPIFNYGGEMWSVMNVLRPDALGTWDEFSREWCNRAEYTDKKARIADPKAFGVYAREAGFMLRRTRRDVDRELPPLQRLVHEVDADTKVIEQAEDRALNLARIILDQNPLARGEKWRASEEISLLLRQATGIAKAPFVADFVRMLAEGGEKVVLYGWHREVYSIWLHRLADLKPAMYTGSESANQKDESKRRFIEGDAQVLLMSLRSGAGLDGLQGHCRTVVFGELDWSPAVHEQAIGRVHRDGQPEPVSAFFLVANGGSDTVIADTLQLKAAQIEGIRNPTQDLVEKLQGDGDNVRRLAEAVLARRKKKAA